MDVITSPINKIENRIAYNPNVVFYAKQFQEKKLLIINNFLTSDLIHDIFLPEIKNCMPMMHRVKMGSFKKSSSVGSHILSNHAPYLFALYHSIVMKNFIEKIVGASLTISPADDLHAVALYCYTESGDHIGVHYDKSFYRGKRYTVLLGLIQDSTTSKLMCYPGSNKFNRRRNPIEVYTHPGTLVIFDGDVLWHEVTPLAENETRIVLTMEYLTDARISPFNRFISNFKDRLLYFGKK